LLLGNLFKRDERSVKGWLTFKYKDLRFMEFSIAALLANFTDDKLVAPKALEKKLDCQDDASIRKLQIALDGLEKIGVVVKDRGRYRRVSEDGLVEGKLRCSSKGFCFAIQDLEGADDIYIRESQLNHAWNGDRVLVRVTKEGSRRRSPEGEVKLILERSNRSVLARVKQVDGGDFRAMPLDDRLLFELHIQENGANLEEAIDQLVHVKVLRYPLGQGLPLGKVARILGESDIDIVACKHDLPMEFASDVLQAAKALPSKIGKPEIKKRMDLRNLTTLTIKADSQQTNLDSLDDAITLTPTKAGHWQLGIHIADVSYYVEAESAIDREAQKRGISVYLGDTITPMLPDPITTNLCAFLVDKDRLALSVLVTLDAEGQVLEYEIQPTVIQVDHQLSYQEAQAILERATDSASEVDIQAFTAIFELLDNLSAVSHTLKEQRRKRGAFELNLSEKPLAGDRPVDPSSERLLTPKFHYDDEGALGAMVVSPSVPTHAMIAELMLLANHLVAQHLLALEVPCIYRVHPTPDPDDVQELMKLSGSMGIDLRLEQDDVVRPQDYQHFTQKFAESDAERVLTYLLLETLKPAFYSMTAKSHFGLALDQSYTHFTSPVRRYPDLLVHRVLHAIFEHGRDRKSTRSKEVVNLRHSSSHGAINWNVLPPEIQQELEIYFNAVVVHLTERERIAQEAEQDLEGLKKAELMRERTGEIFHGLITGVQSYGLFVEIEELLVEGLVHVSSLKDDWYEYRSRQQTLVGRKNRKQYRLGDRIEVQVKSVDYYRQQIDLLAVGGGSDAADLDDSAEDGREDAREDGRDHEPDLDEADDLDLDPGEE
jgi:ribonuclease R